MSLFANSRNIVFTSQNVTMTAYAGSQPNDRGFDLLCQNATPAAMYGSSTSAKDPGCLQGTRLGVQDHTLKWLDDPEGEVAMWMYGPAGIGKTAIAHTVAKLCAERGQLSSAFFFFWSDDGRNSAKNLVPTLAFEMLQQMPYTRDAVCRPVSHNPLIFSAPLERQIRSIILPALLEAASASDISPLRPMLIIIDGLDECMDTSMQQSIIRSFVSLLSATAPTIPHKILLVSRPESHIVSTFLPSDIAPHVRHLCLDEWNSIADIKIYLRAELEKVKNTHPSKSRLNAEWPSADSFDRLLRKSFESFAYATLAVRYISSHDRYPGTSLDHLLGVTPDCAREVHAELDALYIYILESLDEKTRFTILEIMCLESLCYKWEDIDTLSFILGQETHAVELAIARMSSVIRFNSCKRRFSVYHTSFNDFMRDKERSGKFYLYTPPVATAVAEALISRLRVRTTVRDDDILTMIGNLLCNLPYKGVDMQFHILTALLAPCTPTKPFVVTPDFPFLVEFFESIESGMQMNSHSVSVTLLYHQAFECIIGWLWLQATPSTLENILRACFIPYFKRQSELVTGSWLWDILVTLVHRNYRKWCTIRHSLPNGELGRICVALVDTYLAMSSNARERDMRQHAHWSQDSLSDSSLTTVLIQMLQSEPANADLCRVLEKIVLDVLSSSNSWMQWVWSPQRLISSRLISYIRFNDELDWASTVIAQKMDSYIRKTHSQLKIPYISDEVRMLYCGTVSSIERPGIGWAPPREYMDRC